MQSYLISLYTAKGFKPLVDASSWLTVPLRFKTIYLATGISDAVKMHNVRAADFVQASSTAHTVVFL